MNERLVATSERSHPRDAAGGGASSQVVARLDVVYTAATSFPSTYSAQPISISTVKAQKPLVVVVFRNCDI